MDKNLIKNTMLLLSAIMLALAWLNTSYFQPWVTFISDYCAFTSLFFFIVVIVFFKENTKIEIPYINLFLIFIILIPIIQYQFGIIIYWSTAFLSSSYLIGFFLSIIFGYNYYKKDPGILNKIIFLFVICAIFQSLISIVQWLGLSADISWIIERNSSRMYGNFAQPNHLASFLLAALVGLLYLREKENIGWLITNTLSFIFIFSLVLTQSRTSLITFLFITLYIIFYSKYFDNIRIKSIFYMNLIFWFLTFFTQELNVRLNESVGLNIIIKSSMQQRITTGYDRIDMWKNYLSYIYDQPWFGYGWGQVQLSQYYHINSMKVWYTSSHNIILDILLWNGIVVGLLIVIFTFIFMVKIFIHLPRCELLLIYLMVFVFFIHAFFEFPLDYAYFLLPVGILIGILQAVSNKGVHVITVRLSYFYFVIFLYVFLMVRIWWEYGWIVQENHRAVNAGLSGDKYYSVPQKVYFLDQLEAELKLIAIPKTRKLTDDEIFQLEKVVAMKPTFFNLLKFSQILISNDKIEILNNVLHKLNILYGFKIEKSKILELKI
ncbi:PglL family O-oligosaccharyltransferase [Acinetobacter sp. YH12145]|uniref:PglL family O-oligosaccharyltransferase n=1 Tax=Acinetobacter sp. YH12145 TaxID=2601129 RepID=UPI0015D38A9C|nr:Wzy polymerase domain-containing protein [Acinetobacter sp. YH12145]